MAGRPITGSPASAPIGKLARQAVASRPSYIKTNRFDWPSRPVVGFDLWVVWVGWMEGGELGRVGGRLLVKAVWYGIHRGVNKIIKQTWDSIVHSHISISSSLILIYFLQKYSSDATPILLFIFRVFTDTCASNPEFVPGGALVAVACSKPKRFWLIPCKILQPEWRWWWW